MVQVFSEAFRSSRLPCGFVFVFVGFVFMFVAAAAVDAATVSVSCLLANSRLRPAASACCLYLLV